MKFILIIIFCTQGICQTLYDATGYDSYDLCEIESKKMVEAVSKDFPESYGQTHCIEEQEFKKLIEQESGQQI
jgi:hypothetical protein